MPLNKYGMMITHDKWRNLSNHKSHNNFKKLYVFQNQMLTISSNESSKSSWIAKYLHKNNMKTKRHQHPKVVVSFTWNFNTHTHRTPYRRRWQQNPQDILINLVVLLHILLPHQPIPSISHCYDIKKTIFAFMSDIQIIDIITLRNQQREISSIIQMQQQ